MRRCVVFRCREAVGNGRVFCAKHWSMIPRRFRERLMGAYRPGQREGSADWRLALVRAANIVAVHEGMSLEQAWQRENQVLREIRNER